MKTVYCANCGMALKIIRKPLPKYGRIIDVVPYHECSETPLELDIPLTSEVPKFEGKDKFVKKIDDLRFPSSISTLSLGDQRKIEHVRSEKDSTAPTNLLRQVKDLQNSIPERDFEDVED